MNKRFLTELRELTGSSTEESAAYVNMTPGGIPQA